MNDRLKINIKIADSKHPLFISREDEEVVRKAALLVNERLAAYSRKYRTVGLPQAQLMAFAALDIAIKYLKTDADSNAERAEADIESMVAELHQYLNK